MNRSSVFIVEKISQDEKSEIPDNQFPEFFPLGTPSTEQETSTRCISSPSKALRIKHYGWTKRDLEFSLECKGKEGFSHSSKRIKSLPFGFVVCRSTNETEYGGVAFVQEK